MIHDLTPPVKTLADLSPQALGELVAFLGPYFELRGNIATGIPIANLVTPGTTTTFLRGDGTFVALPATTTELAYVEHTTDVTVSGTTSGSPTDLSLTTGSLTFDGSTIVLIRFYTYDLGAAGSGVTHVGIYLDGSLLKEIAQTRSVGAGGVDVTCLAEMRYTPSAGSHTFAAKAWRDTADGVVAATGKAPAFLRVSTAA